jgi:hypothetical protein
MQIRLNVGGEWITVASGECRIHCEEVDLPGEDAPGELQIVITNEGMILDVWGDNDGESCNFGTSSETFGEIISRLMDDNA